MRINNVDKYHVSVNKKKKKYAQILCILNIMH